MNSLFVGGVSGVSLQSCNDSCSGVLQWHICVLLAFAGWRNLVVLSTLNLSQFGSLLGAEERLWVLDKGYVLSLGHDLGSCNLLCESCLIMSLCSRYQDRVAAFPGSANSLEDRRILLIC